MPQHHALKSLIHNFEEDPKTQVKFHWFMMMFWIANAIVGTVVAILFPGTWVAIGVLYVFLLSIYANWDTDYGAVSAAQASLKSEYLVSVEHDKPVDVTVEKVVDAAEAPAKKAVATKRPTKPRKPRTPRES